jgi:undecaprenyl-diphosphatase
LYATALEVLFFAMLVLVCALARHQRWVAVRRAAVAAGLSAGLGLLAGKLITEFVHRARPFVAHPGAVHLFARHAADSSFPSDHATASVAIVVAILLRGKLRWAAVTLVFAIILMFGRVALGLEYPTDVLGGAAIGTAAALILWIAPIRERIDALSDRAGGLWDRASDPVVRRVLVAKPARSQ